MCFPFSKKTCFLLKAHVSFKHDFHLIWRDAYFPPKLNLVGGFNPSEKYESNWIIFPNRDANKKYFKPPPRNSSRTSKSGIRAKVAGGAEEGGGGAIICGAHGAEGGTCMGCSRGRDNWGTLRIPAGKIGEP